MKKLFMLLTATVALSSVSAFANGSKCGPTGTDAMKSESSGTDQTSPTTVDAKDNRTTKKD